MNYIARTVTENPAYMQAKIKVPTGETLHAGQVVVAEDLDASLGYGNWDVYAPTQVADADTDEIAIILDGGFETLADGRRPDGNPDYTTYTFGAGEVVTTSRLVNHVKYEISVDAGDDSVKEATIVPGDNLIPKASQYELSYSAKGTAVTAKNYLTVEAVKSFRLGGQFGNEWANTMVVRTKVN